MFLLDSLLGQTVKYLTRPNTGQIWASFVPFSVWKLHHYVSIFLPNVVDIFRVEFPLTKLWDVTQIRVSYGKYTTLNMLLFWHLISWKRNKWPIRFDSSQSNASKGHGLKLHSLAFIPIKLLKMLNNKIGNQVCQTTFKLVYFCVIISPNK